MKYYYKYLVLKIKKKKRKETSSDLGRKNYANGSGLTNEPGHYLREASQHFVCWRKSLSYL